MFPPQYSLQFSPSPWGRSKTNWTDKNELGLPWPTSQCKGDQWSQFLTFQQGPCIHQQSHTIQGRTGTKSPGFRARHVRAVGSWESGKHMLNLGRVLKSYFCWGIAKQSAWEIQLWKLREGCRNVHGKAWQTQRSPCTSSVTCPSSVGVAPVTTVQGGAESTSALKTTRCIGQRGIHLGFRNPGWCPQDLKEAAPRNEEN